MRLAEGHLKNQIEVEGEGTPEERECAILDLISLKDELKTFNRELLELKKQRTNLSKLNAAAKAVVVEAEKNVGRCNKPV